MLSYMNYGGKWIVVIPRRAGKGHNFVTIPSEKSVLNGPSMGSILSRIGLPGLYSIVFEELAAKMSRMEASKTTILEAQY